MPQSAEASRPERFCGGPHLGELRWENWMGFGHRESALTRGERRAGSRAPLAGGPYQINYSRAFGRTHAGP